MKNQTLSEYRMISTPNNISKKSTSNNTNITQKSQIKIEQPPILKPRQFSFKDNQNTKQFDIFFNSIITLNTLSIIGKRITDPNVLMINSTQKQTVQMIIQNNKKQKDQKSKFLTERGKKYLKFIWKIQKYNDSIVPFFKNKSLQQFKNIKQKSLSPKSISTKSKTRQLQQKKILKKRSMSRQSNNSLTIKSRSKNKLITPNKRQQYKKKQKSFYVINKRQKNTSQDHNFQKVTIKQRSNSRIINNKSNLKQVNQKQQINLNQNITSNTLLFTQKFQNMLKMMKNQKL